MTELAEVVAALENGMPVVLPTDTVYGLCALPGVTGAIDRLFELKGRRHDAPIAVLCTSDEQAFALADQVLPAHRVVATGLWPGPLTMVLRRRASLDWDLGEPADTIGVRIPDHAVLRDLTSQLGPIAATSANRHGAGPARTVADVVAQLGDVVMLDGGMLGETASTVVDATSEPWQILRAGAVSVAELRASGAPV